MFRLNVRQPDARIDATAGGYWDKSARKSTYICDNFLCIINELYYSFWRKIHWQTVTIKGRAVCHILGTYFVLLVAGCMVGGGGWSWKTRLLTSAIFESEVHTVNEGPMRMQYKFLVPIYVFPEIKLHGLLFPKQNYNGLSPNFHTYVSVSDLYIPQSVCRGKYINCSLVPWLDTVLSFRVKFLVFLLLSGRLVIINSNSCLQNHSPCWHRPFGGWFYITAGLQPYTQMVYNDTWLYTHDLYFSKKAFSLNKKYSVRLCNSI